MGFNVMTGVDPGYLNAGLRKPKMGFTLVAGKEKLGVGFKFLLTPSEKFTKVIDENRLHRGYREMRGILTFILAGVAILLVISSCSTVPKGPLGPGELRLLRLEVPENGNLQTTVPYMVGIKFEADGHPEIRRVCFSWSGDNLRCVRVKNVRYGSDAGLEISVYAPEGQNELECYIEYVRDGKVIRTNSLTSFVNGR